MSEDRLKIALFIDFDNIEIGVKTTLGGQFDVGAVLEAMKERGEVVSKIAYGDWTRATDYGRSMSQHAIHMVQRNLTPGGDKNGADINLALDALEMAFTHSHINAFVIVGGDSDFLSLIEKLKQYDRKVFVVGGRSFTSQVMQKNCTEFIAYEDILGPPGRGRRTGGQPRIQTDIAAALPLIRRALQVLADREVTPQLGLLKSTLLQLDSSFSERAYGATSFRDFVEKLASAGHLVLKGADRSYQVELRELSEAAAGPSLGPSTSADREPMEPHRQRERGHRPASRQEGRDRRHGRDTRSAPPADGGASDHGDAATALAMPAQLGHDAASPEGVGRPGPMDGYRIMAQAFSRGGSSIRFPMYVRQFKQLMKAFDESFDERRYGFAGVLDALRFGQREGLFRLDRDRHGGVRVHPGPQYLSLTQSAEAAPAATAPVTDESAQDRPLPIEASVDVPPDAPHPEGEPQAMPESSPLAADLPSPLPPVEAAPSPPSEEPKTEETGPSESPVEPAMTPRAAPRRRTSAPRATRTKKAAPAAGGARKKTARPRAKQS